MTNAQPHVTVDQNGVTTRRRRLTDDALLSFADFLVNANDGEIPPAAEMVRALRALGYAATNQRCAAALRGEPLRGTALVEVIVRLRGEDDLVLKP